MIWPAIKIYCEREIPGVGWQVASQMRLLMKGQNAGSQNNRPIEMRPLA